jgi:hypothetical protein
MTAEDLDLSYRGTVEGTGSYKLNYSFKFL